MLDTGDVPPSFREDAWVGQVLQVGDTAKIRLTTTAPRFVTTTVEQPGLAHDPAILRAAATNRHRFEGIGTLGCAGAYAEVVEPGHVHVGDPVVLLRPADSELLVVGPVDVARHRAPPSREVRLLEGSSHRASRAAGSAPRGDEAPEALEGKLHRAAVFADVNYGRFETSRRLREVAGSRRLRGDPFA